MTDEPMASSASHVRRALGAVSFWASPSAFRPLYGVFTGSGVDASYGLGLLPPPLAGEGRGGGERARSVLGHAPSLAFPPKSDVSDFGRSIKRSNSGKPEFDCKRGRECTERVA